MLLEEWGKRDDINRVDVVCPAFAADCLETLEEIAEQNRATFLEAGGKDYHYIPCLNDQPDHIDMLADLVARHASPGPEQLSAEKTSNPQKKQAI